VRDHINLFKITNRGTESVVTAVFGAVAIFPKVREISSPTRQNQD
jgi:hypothetical protein